MTQNVLQKFLSHLPNLTVQLRTLSIAITNDGFIYGLEGGTVDFFCLLLDH